MEYLMTYGWAILVIAVVLGVLFEMGVFSSNSFAVRAPPGGCQVFRTSAVTSLVGQCSGQLPQYVAQFNGQSSFVSMGNPTLLYPTSVSFFAWVYPTGTAIGDYVIKNDMSYFFVVARQGDGSFLVQVNLMDSVGTWRGRWSATNTLSGNQWGFLGFTYDGNNNLVIWVNGQPTALSLSGVGTLTNQGFFQLGQRGSGSFYQGSLSNVQVYNISLDSSTVATLYQRGIGGAPLELRNIVGWWPLNGNSNDYSGNGKNGFPSAISYATQWLSGYVRP
jgi:hypothetical protein